MRTSFWIGNRASIILLPSGKQGEALFELAKNWAEVGLLGPALWVVPEAVSFPEGEPVRVTARVVGTDKDGQPLLAELDLFEQLARENLEIIRLVKVRSIIPQADFDELQNRIAREVESALHSAVPSRDVRDAQNASTTFRVINLIAAPSSHSVAERLLGDVDGSNATVVASPEDRSTPWSVDAFIRNGDRFVGFVLMHLATVGGVWNGLPVGTLELKELEESAGQKVWLSRVFVSTVLTDGLARRVAAQALVDAGDPTSSIDTPPPNCAFIEDHVKDEYIDSMVGYIMKLDEAVLDYHRPPLLQDPDQIDMSILQAVGDFFVFSGRKIVKIPNWAYRFVRRKLGGFVERKLQGDEGLARVEADLRNEPLDLHDRALLEKEISLAYREEEARKASVAPVRLSDIRSTPSLWREIREMVFGALDGGVDLSNRGFPPVDGTKRPVFRSAGDLFPSPDSIFRPSESSEELPAGVPAEISWENLADVTDAHSALEAWVSAAKNETDKHNTLLSEYSREEATLTKRLSELVPQLSEWSALTEDPDGNLSVITQKEARAIMADAKAADGAEEAAEDVEPYSSESVDPASLQPEVAETKVGRDLPDLVQMVREYQDITKRLKALPGTMESEEVLSRQSMAQEEDRENVLSAFRKWQDGNSRSLVWRLRSKMGAALGSAKADLANFRAKLDGITPHTPGTLIDLRRRFHRSLLVTHGIVWAIAGFAAAAGWGLMTWADRSLETLSASAPVSQEALANQGAISAVPSAANIDQLLANANKMVVDLESELVVISESLEESPESEQLLTERETVSDLLATAQGYESQLRAYPLALSLAQLGERILVWTAIATPTLLLLSLFGLLIPYYRGWTEFRRQVDIQLTNLDRIQTGNRICRSEIDRLNVLLQQAMDWLKILAATTHNPWKVRQSWLDSGLNTLHLESLPFAMKVAQAHDGDHAAFSTLSDAANGRLIQPGWRRRAFEFLVDQIAEETGKSPKMFSVDMLDRDLPHASNNSRSHLTKHMVSSELLEGVAIKFLKPLIEELQGKAMATARPEVFRIEQDGLEEFRRDVEGIEEIRKFEEWDAFLSATLTLGEDRPDPITALSVMSIAPSKVIDGEHEMVESFALLPEHVNEKMSSGSLQGVTLAPYDSKIVRPLDSVVRIDLVGPISLSSLRVAAADDDSPGPPVEEEESSMIQGPAL